MHVCEITQEAHECYRLWQAELEDEMKLLSIDTQGTKQDLVERAHAYLSTEQVCNVYSADLTPVQLGLCWTNSSR